MLRTVVLHGALGERFGRTFEFDIVSPIEAVRALMTQLQGFRRHFRDGHYRIIRRHNKKRVALSLEQLDLRLGGASELHIVPVVAGAASGLTKVLIGVAIVGLAIAAPYALGLAGGLGASAIGGATIFGSTITFGQIAAVGLGLALSGVSQMLAPTPKTNQAAVDRQESFLFSGQDNVATQGGPIPTVFGLFLVGSTIISAGLTVEQISGASGGTPVTVSQLMAAKLAGH